MDRLVTLFVAASLGVCALGLALARAQTLPDGPVDIAWDKEACAHCHMLVGDPSFAAQIQERDGRVLDFDDPGCLLRFQAENALQVHAIWFHERGTKRWLPAARTAFVSVATTPMGYGFAAVEVGTPGSLPLEDARSAVLGARPGRVPRGDLP